MVIADNQLHTLQTTLLKLLQKLSPVDLRLAESAADPNHLPLAPAVDAVNRYVEIEGIITLKDTATVEPPPHVPGDIDAVFREGATCLAVCCNNAAGTMFRLCIDLVTRTLLPEEETEGLNRATRRHLGLRLPWLFDNGHLPEGLRQLSTCVKEDGNDGAHAGNLSTEDAENLLAFTTILLERLYTEPERLRVAEERRIQRRNPDT